MLIASILIYSGRENPRWVIEGEAEQTLLARLQGLPILPCGPSAAPGLGYSGIELVREGGRSGTQSWRVYEGRVSHGGRCFEDRDRQFERSVIELGRAKVGDQIPADLF